MTTGHELDDFGLDGRDEGNFAPIQNVHAAPAGRSIESQTENTQLIKDNNLQGNHLIQQLQIACFPRLLSLHVVRKRGCQLQWRREENELPRSVASGDCYNSLARHYQ